MLRLRLLPFSYSLTKTPENNTPATKITSLYASLEAIFVAHFVAAVLWHGYGQIFCCCSKLRNKSSQQKSTCVIRVS